MVITEDLLLHSPAAPPGARCPLGNARTIGHEKSTVVGAVVHPVERCVRHVRKRSPLVRDGLVTSATAGHVSVASGRGCDFRFTECSAKIRGRMRSARGFMR